VQVKFVQDGNTYIPAALDAEILGKAFVSD